jgi:hypothetical protein
MNVNPYYFWQLAQDINDYPGTPVPIDAVQPCNFVVYDAGFYGGSQSGRDEVWNAILLAEDQFRNYAGYFVAPSYACDEWSFRYGDHRGHIRLRNAKIKALGKEALTLLGTVSVSPVDSSGNPLDITDENGDGLLDTTTIRIPVQSGVSADEISVYFRESDWVNGTTRCRNEIRPIRVKETAGQWVITFSSWMMVKPKLHTGLPQRPLDPENLSIYATSVDVYRRWTDPSTAIVAQRKNRYQCRCGQTEDCYVCENAEACIVNAERGMIEIKWSGAECCHLCTERLCINYLSGDCGNESLIARLAAAYLGRDVCCGGNPEIKYWMADYIATDDRGKVVTSLSDYEKSNQFGTRRGQVDAFRYLRTRRAIKAIRI